jgi:4-hydroxybenzoate polyprenyltransferase
LVGLLFGLIYSLPPIRLKERPLLSLIAYGFGFLSAYFMGFSMFYSSLQAGIKPWVLSLLIIALGSLAFLADYAADLKAKQKTIATHFGEKFTLNVVLICYLIVLILRPFVSLVSLLYLIFSVALIIYLKLRPSERLAKVTLYSLASFGGLAIFLATVFKY